jgi:acid phosphatase
MKFHWVPHLSVVMATLFGAIALLTACGGASAVAPDPTAEAPAATEVVHADVVAIPPSTLTLSATLWTQTSLEYAGLTRMVFQAATALLDDAAADPQWQALVEYELPEAVGDAGALPPAVIVDLDETIMDNSAYQAWRVVHGIEYSRDTWNAWALDAEAGLVPGALEFLQACDAMDIAVFYVSNRYAETEAATIENLEQLGVPLPDDAAGYMLFREERPEWAASDKTPRRQAVAQNYRVIMLVGDAIGDFFESGGFDAPGDAWQSHWGTRWWVLPNAQYGGWNRVEVPEGVDPMAPWLERLRSWDGP